jgi:hypothetical protein
VPKALPGPVLDSCIAFVTGRGPVPELHTFRGSYNLKLLARLTGTLRGDAPSARELCDLWLGELDGRDGLGSDEFGGGYSGIPVMAALCVVRRARDGGIAGDLLAAARRWYGAMLRMRALLAVPHRDSVVTIGPGARLRSPTVEALQPFVQATIGAPVRRYGIAEGSGGRDQAAYFWRGDDQAAARIRELTGGPPKLAGECGVDPGSLRSWIERGDPALGRELARGLRLHHPTVIRRYPGGDLAAWWPAFTSGDAPCAGAVSIGGEISVLQPQPIGPRSGTDTQHWGGANTHRAAVEEATGELVGQFVTATGLTSPDGEARRREHRVPLPPGEPILELVIGPEGVGEYDAPPPGPRPEPLDPPRPRPPGPPAPPPLAEDCRARGRRVLDALLVMRGRRPGTVTADQLEALIREEFGL